MPVPERLADGVWRLALPSATLPPYDHTNSYLVCDGPRGVLVDAGSDEAGVLGALQTALSALGVTDLGALLLTHMHPDHCAGAEVVATRYGVPVLAHPLERGRLDFPTQPLRGGERALVGGLELRALHTPGHSPGHLSFFLPHARAALVGDLLAAQGSTWVGHPEGDVSDYLASLDLLAGLDAVVFGPGHGPPVLEPASRLRAVRAHRLGREADILRRLRQPCTLTALKAQVYPDVPDTLAQLVEGTLRAHLGKLLREGRVVMTSDARYQRVASREQVG